MKSFDYYQPTQIHFGCGRVGEVGEVVSRCGKRCLLVTVPTFDAMRPVFEKVKASLEAAGVAVAHFDGVIPNPTTDSVTAGARMAKKHKADVVLGVGGGSSMDTAKAIAVEATHKGTAWDYLYFKTQPTPKMLPVVAVTTTSGTGSQVTHAAVVTNPAERCKSAILNSLLHPRAAIVDPELMLTVPARITAATGFDVFTHAFESFLHPAASPYTDLVALEALRLAAEHLAVVVQDGADLVSRTAMAWADTAAGLAIANAGVTLPHGVGMAISGMYPHVAHGEALALVYPAFTRYTCGTAVERFAIVGRILDPQAADASDEAAAETCCRAIDDLLKRIGLWAGLKDVNVPESELPDLTQASMVLPDYKNNPRVATSEEMQQLLEESYRR